MAPGGWGAYARGVRLWVRRRSRRRGLPLGGGGRLAMPAWLIPVYGEGQYVLALARVGVLRLDNVLGERGRDLG